MTNLEFYSETIMGITGEHSDIAIVDNKPEACTGQCENCARNERQCDDVSLMNWLMAVCCPFKEGDVVEVRDGDQEHWKLAIFTRITDSGDYLTDGIMVWKHARPYGSYGREVKNDKTE